jgi:chemotaxis signal transduction protein
MNKQQIQVEDGGEDLNLELVQFQTSLLKQIDERQASKTTENEQTIWVESKGKIYTTDLDKIYAVVDAPERFLNLGRWCHGSVLGGLLYRDDLWVVFDGFKQTPIEDESRTWESWLRRVLICRVEDVEGYVGILVDKVLGVTSKNEESVKGVPTTKKVEHIIISEWGGQSFVKNIEAEPGMNNKGIEQ